MRQLIGELLAALHQHPFQGKEGNLKINLVDIKAGLRTTGGLLIGNSMVIPILTKFTTPEWWWMLLLGFVLILATSITKE